jgi:glutathione S-transferase
VVNINLKNKPQWYLDKVNPLGMVPSITWNDFTAIESSVVGDYLDEKFPGPKLSAQSPEQKAKNASLIAIYGSKVHIVFLTSRFNHNENQCKTLVLSTLQVLNQSYKLYREIPEEERAKTVENLLAGLTMIEEELAKRGTPFFHGQTVGTVDYYIWPWFERMFVLENHFKRVTFNWAENYPKLVSVIPYY